MRDPAYFARFIQEAISQLDSVVCYEQFSGVHVSLIWPELGDSDWREAVRVAIPKEDYEQVEFIPPDPTHEWAFLAVKKGRTRYHLN